MTRQKKGGPLMEAVQIDEFVTRRWPNIPKEITERLKKKPLFEEGEYEEPPVPRRVQGPSAGDGLWYLIDNLVDRAARAAQLDPLKDDTGPLFKEACEKVRPLIGKDDAPLDVPLSTYPELERAVREADTQARRRRDAERTKAPTDRGEAGRDHLKTFRPKTIDEIIACGKTAAAWAAEGLPQVEWAIPQWVAFGSLTSIEGRPKKHGGKSTLASWMVRALLDGDEFLGQRATKARAIWFSEQPPVIFRHLLRRAGLDERDDLKVYYRQNLPDAEWRDLMRAASKDAKGFGARVVVVDTVAAWAGLRGAAENNSGDALEAIKWIGPLLAAGIAVIIVRHERKKGGEVGKAGRGSSAWEGAINHIISVRRVRGEPDSRVRQLFISSHLAEDVPESLTIRLRDPAKGEGEGYEALGTPEDYVNYGVPGARKAIVDVLPSDPRSAMLRKAIAERLPEVAPATLTRALAELKKEKRVRQTRGKGYYQATAGSDGSRGEASDHARGRRGQKKRGLMRPRSISA